VIYFSGVVRADMPAMVTPRMRQRPAEGQPWAADNGRFASPHEYTDAGYLAWLEKMPSATCVFATAPDVVGDAEATLALASPMFNPIRKLGYRVALVAQDGFDKVPTPWDDFDALFIGGTTGWKLGSRAAKVAAEAKARGKWVHMGRVNSFKRLVYAQSIGCDSADGTVLKHDPNRPVRRWVDRVNAAPSVWS
jgi:hypothetical protein